MGSKYRITNVDTNEVYEGYVHEVEEQTGVNRRLYDWYSNFGLLYQFKWKIERI